MIQQEYKNNVESTTGKVETTGFNIEINESMFQLLTSNVYNNPILAVMREWSTNACDACIAAGSEVKFDVHLPTLSEPHFSVRDYGTGLSPEDVTGLFSNLGASTKRDSNKYNGAMGIGRMAGLAVSNAFTVDSYLNGKHYSFAISMQNGIPVTMSLGTLNTDQPNGLKLSVAVDYSDIDRYISETRDLYKHFDHKPNLNISDIDITIDTTNNISDDWFLDEKTNSWSRDNYVVMSQVAYAIPDNTAVENHGFRNLVLKAPPGSVTFNPGREALSLNKTTIDYLNKAFDKVKDDYVYNATVAMAACDTDKELMACYSKVTEHIPHHVCEKIDPTIFVSKEYQQMFSAFYRTSSNGVSFKALSMTDVFKAATNDLLLLAHKSSYYKTSKPITTSTAIDFTKFFSSTHIVVDVKTKFKSAIGTIYNGKDVVTWQRTGKADIDEAVQEAKTYLGNMGIDYKLASEVIKEDGTGVSTSVLAARTGFYASCIRPHGGVSQSTKMEEQDFTDGIYLYVKMKNTTPVISSKTHCFDDYLSMYGLLSRFCEMPKIRGVAKKYQEVVDDLDNWVDFEGYIEGLVKTVTFKKDDSSHTVNFVNNCITPATKYLYPTDIQDLYDEVHNYKHKHVLSDNYVEEHYVQSIAKNFDVSFEDYVPVKNISMDKIDANYPVTMRLLTNSLGYTYTVDACTVSKIAKLEAFYAIHSPK